MPKMISELAQGNAFSRSSDGGQLADTATRVFKIILDSPSESIDLMSAVGVQIGDPYNSSNPMPCVSVEGRADGESRLVRIVTAQYRTSGMVDGEGGTGMPDPMLVMPELRPANFSTSTSLYEAAAYLWVRDGQWEPAHNPVGDLMDGVTRMEPITTIRVTQFNSFPGTVFQRYAGYVNLETMNLGSYMTCDPSTVLFRGVEAQPHVETFGNAVFSGFMNSYEFAYKANEVEAPGYAGKYGWDMALPVTGFNCKAFNPAQPRGGNDAEGGAQDPYAVPLKRDGEYGPIVQPLALQDGVAVGDKVRAMVRIAGSEKTINQQPSAQPIALNEDGTPRSPNATPKVLIWRVRTQLNIDLTQTLQLRLN
jgi:hypothetical protein